MKNPKSELSKRYKNISLLLAAVEQTIIQPCKSVVDHLNAKGDSSKTLAAALIAGGAIYGTKCIGGVIGASATLRATRCLAKGATAVALGGPVVWTIVGGGAIASVIYGLVKKTRLKKKEQEEKENLTKRIIAKQQAIINKLSQQNQYNQREIQNLKEALQMLKETEAQVRCDFSLA